MKKYIAIITIAFICGVSLITYKFNYAREISENKTTKIKNSNTLSMMLETGYKTGEYVAATAESYPTEGYLFNEEMSKCENGSRVIWNEETNRIQMIGKISDKCYVYFDKYNLAIINDLSSSVTTSSITVTADVTVGSNSIVKYYFSINDGNYVETSTSSYTFNNLSLKTKYTIKVKVIDSIGKESKVFSKDITTSSYMVPSITSITTSTTSNSITIKINGKNGTGTISKYYYSKNNGSSYTSSTSNSYTFTGLSVGTYYIKVYVKDNNGYSSSVSSKTVVISNPTMADYIKSLYTGTQGVNDIYYHNSSLNNGAGDNSYRYSGDDPNNYVCFGSTASSCPVDNLYRIIGVIDGKVRLIKFDYANSNLLGTDGDYDSSTYSTSVYDYYKGSFSTVNRYYWNKNAANTWSESSLNTINLNKNFLSKIGSTWANKIASTTWKVSGSAKLYQGNPSSVLEKENASTTTYTSKIGLMYAGDYGFATDKSYWTTSLSDFNTASVRSSNWMFSGLLEWTITRDSSATRYSYIIRDIGYLNYDSVDNSFAVRPVFNLNTNVQYSSGTGSKSNPYRIN